MDCGIYKSSSVIQMAVGASEVIKAKSGRWVNADDAGYIDISGASDVDILGWVLGTFEETSNGTDGVTKWDVETDIFTKLFIMPACQDSGAAVTEAQLQAAVGTSLDIQMVSTNYQYADLGASATDILLVYGYVYEGSSAGQQYAIVKPNVNKLAYTSHTDV